MPLLWTRVIGVGESVDPALIPALPAERGPFRPDLPKSFYDAGGCVQVDVASLCRDLVTGGWFGSHMRLNVRQEHADLIPTRYIVPYGAIPARTLLMLEMLRKRHSERRAWFEAMAAPASQAAKRSTKDVLLQAVARGLSPIEAQAIIARLALPSESRTESIDDEAVSAYVAYVRRAVTRRSFSGGRVVNLPITEADARAAVLASIRSEKAGL